MKLADRIIGRIQSLWFTAVLVRFIPLMLLNPNVLDLMQSFIPDKYMPGILLSYIEAGANWTVTTVWVISALVISTYLVHRHNQKHCLTVLEELRRKVSAYENHKPDYEIVINEVKASKNCSCHTHITGLIDITPKNAWEGTLSGKPFIQCEDEIIAETFFDENWTLSVQKFRENQCPVQINFPYPIAVNGKTVLVFDLKCPLRNEDVKAPFLSESVSFLVELVYAYYSPALGHYVEDKQSIGFTIDLLEVERY